MKSAFHLFFLFLILSASVKAAHDDGVSPSRDFPQSYIVVSGALVTAGALAALLPRHGRGREFLRVFGQASIAGTISGSVSPLADRMWRGLYANFYASRVPLGKAALQEGISPQKTSEPRAPSEEGEGSSGRR